MIRRTLTALLLMLMLLGCSDRSKSPRPGDWVIAAGPDTVYTDEFVKRYSTSAVPGSGLPTRVDFARSILLEHQLAREAESLKLDTARVAQVLLTQMENEALVQTLLAREVDERISISEAMLREQFFRMNRNLAFEAWIFRDSTDAAATFRRITDGSEFFNASTVDPSGSRIFLRDQPLRYGQASPLFEDIAYSMKLDDISDPFYDQGLWWILHLTHFEQERVPSEAAFAAAAPTLRGTILRRMRGPKQREYIAEVMRGNRVEFNPLGLQRLADFLAPTMSRAEPTTSQPPELLVQARPMISEALHDEAWLDEPLITFSGNSEWSWSGREVVERLAVMPQPLSLSGDEAPVQLVRRALIYLAEFETLSQTAREEGLLQDPEVVGERDLWQRHVLAVRARQYFKELALTTETSDTLQRWYERIEATWPERVQSGKLRDLEVTDLPVLIAKTHYPLRLATPTPAGLDLLFKPREKATGVQE